MLRATRILLIAFLALGAAAPAAFAQGSPEPGVTVDPSGPASKEYALPVDKARQDASSSKKKKSSLFGEGVTSKKSTTTQSPTTTSTTTTTPTTTTPSTTTSQSALAAAKAEAQAKARAKAKAKARARKRAAERRARARARRAEQKRKKEAAAAAATTNTTPPSAGSTQDVSKLSSADASNPSGGLGSSVLFGLIGLGVLIVGGAAGLLLRRRLQTGS